MAPRQRARPLTVRSLLGCGGSLRALVLTVVGCGSPASDPAASSPGSGMSRATLSSPAGDTVPVDPVVSSTSSSIPSSSGLTGSAGGLTPFPARREGSVPLGTGTVATQKGGSLQAAPLPSAEQQAQQPGDAIDPMTYALVDEDDTVRARAQELYEQQLAREAEGHPDSEVA